MHIMHKIFYLIVLIGILPFLSDIAGAKEYVATKIIDGNTIKLDTGEIVKYIGVEAPDLYQKDEGPEFFARQASRYNQKLVFMKKVRLEFDKERKDKNGNTLAYVFVKKTFVNAELIKLGYAKAHIVSPNNKYKTMFLDLEKSARQSVKGLWQKTKKDTETYYIGDKRTYLFHRPSCKYVDKIPEKSKIIFRNRTDAIDIGYIPDKMCKP